jgi:DNA-binding LytR/AlgR family response regulator
MRFKCIIVEDEPLAQDILETYLNGIPDIELIGKFDNALQAFQFLKKNKVDLMFLDIQMPQLNGIDFLKAMHNYPSVIITTAFRDYALDSFELNVVDYLLKPISLERFLKAINKFYSSIQAAQPGYQSAPAPADDHIYVSSERKQIKILLNDILYLESMKDYVVIYKTDSKIITKNTLSHFEGLLPPASFLRIHRSYIVSISKILSVTKSSIGIGKKELVIGKQYKGSVINVLGVKI